jgi:hypothetical protein
LSTLLNRRKLIIAASFVFVFALAVYVFSLFVEPVIIVSNVLGSSFYKPDRINSLFYYYIRIIITSSLIVIISAMFYGTRFWGTFKKSLFRLITRFAYLFNLRIVFFVILIYLVVLSVIGVMNYDLGIDEAWYLEFAKYFSNTSIPYYVIDGRIIRIDTISMLPYYLTSLINFNLGFTEIWNFKLLNTILSFLGLFVSLFIVKKSFRNEVAVLFLFFIAIQPGFGFISISFFGELLQAAFMFIGLSLWLRSPSSRFDFILAALMFSIAIHTKFQLIFLFSLSFVAVALTDKQSQAFRMLLYTVAFSVLISILRTVPVLIKDPSLVANLALLTDLFDTKSSSTSTFEIALNKIQLFNRFFPLPVFLIIMPVFYYYMKTTFERFLFYFSSVTVLWWIFLYPHSTYRNPFMGIIVLCLMAAILINKLYLHYFSEAEAGKLIKLRYISAFAVLILMFYGFSANIIYAYIGYNDGVQFDMDGFKNRLFGKIERDNSQKEFYYELRKIVNPSDTLYGGSFVAKFYLHNPIMTTGKIRIDSSDPQTEKLVLVTRDLYPLGFDEVYSHLDSLGSKRLILKKPGHELYGIKNKKPVF